MIEDKEIKKRELKDRIIVTADLDEKNAPRSRRRQNVNFFVERGRFILLLLALIIISYILIYTFYFFLQIRMQLLYSYILK